MYKKTVNKNGSFCYEKTGKNNVLPDFISCLEYGKPDNIRETKTILYVFFSGKYSELYTLPVSCKKYL